MQIFYTYKNKIISDVGIENLKKYSDNKTFASADKYTEHLCGLYMVNFIAKNYFNIDDPKIVYDNDKPYFVNSDLKFSLSHSNDIIAVVFSKDNVGIDVEFMKPRDITKFSNRYIKNFRDISSLYSFWTNYEAVYKLGNSSVSKYSTIIDDKYFLTCVSDTVMIGDFSLKLL